MPLGQKLRSGLAEMQQTHLVDHGRTRLIAITQSVHAV